MRNICILIFVFLEQVMSKAESTSLLFDWLIVKLHLLKLIGEWILSITFWTYRSFIPIDENLISGVLIRSLFSWFHSNSVVKTYGCIWFSLIVFDCVWLGLIAFSCISFDLVVFYCFFLYLIALTWVMVRIGIHQRNMLLDFVVFNFLY